MARGHISQLDDHCLWDIFSHLSMRDVINVQKVCRRWDILGDDAWKKVEYLRCYDGQWFLERKCFDQELVLFDIHKLYRILQRYGKHITDWYLAESFKARNHQGYISALETIPHLCVNLTKIGIDLVPGLDPTLLQPLLQCVNIKNLTIGPIELDHENVISQVLSKYKKLRAFGLGSLCVPTGEILRNLPADLEEFRIYVPVDLEQEFAQFVARAFDKFSCLRKFYCDWRQRMPKDTMADAIGRTQTLVDLSIKEACNTVRSFNFVAKLHNLEHLDLSYNQNLFDNDLMNITINCQRIKTLSVAACNRLSEDGLERITEMRHLEVLDIGYLESVSDNLFFNLPATLKVLYSKSCVNLTDDGVTALVTRAMNLTTVDLSLCPAVTNESMIAVMFGVQHRFLMGINPQMLLADLIRDSDARNKFIEGVVKTKRSLANKPILYNVAESGVEIPELERLYGRMMIETELGSYFLIRDRYSEFPNRFQNHDVSMS